MKIQFFKYHGNGNDFILIDNRDGRINLDQASIVKMCHRRFGIGSDGVILLESDEECDYHMNFFNPDGSQSFCGNGSRCALDLAGQLNVITNKARFRAIDGVHEALKDGDIMRIHMHDVSEIEKGEDYYYLNTGSPHYVSLVNDVASIDVNAEGRKVRYNDRFKELGTNVNFLQLTDGKVFSRVYERGVENETYSSGTGTTAIAISAYLTNPNLGNSIDVNTKGGIINVSFQEENGEFSNIWLSGKVELVFEGEYEL